jgi:hypothetical protein
VFAAAANLLALIAFTVHAVFGCCVHHHHHALTETCVVELASDTCCHEHDSHEHETATGHHGCTSHDDQHSSPSDSPAAPCDGSHDCNEPSCSFISASSSSLTDINDQSSIVVCFGDSIQLMIVSCRTPFGASRHFEAAGPPATSSLRCAIAQSWQI